MTDPEDSALEEALRADLPSDEAAARIRRRLLAAGVAVGNGMAATSAAAAGAAPGVAGAVAKASGLSWGLKLGLAAAIAIPTVGLLAERSPEPRPTSSAPAQVAPRPAERPTSPTPVRDTVRGPESPAAAEPEPARIVAQPEPGAAPPARVKASESEAPSLSHAPSQVEFAPADAPSSNKPSSTLAEETRLLDAAFAALAAGNSASANQLVTEHEARFPRGLLVRERERARARLNEITRGQ